MHRPTELRQFLRELGISPRKSMSQNFLIDGNIVEKVVDAAEIERGDRVVEIGPGPGALTEALLSRGARVVAIEKDRALAAALGRLDGDLEVHSTDILEFPVDQLPSEFKVVSSLPYSITTPILALLAPLYDRILLEVMIMQEEVARRLTRERSSITLFLECYSDLEYLFSISRNCFYPVPRVDSAVIRLRPHSPPLENPGPFHEMVRRAFGQRRKMLRNSLGRDIEPLLIEMGLSPTARPEELSLDQFLTLFSKSQDE